MTIFADKSENKVADSSEPTIVIKTPKIAVNNNVKTGEIRNLSANIVGVILQTIVTNVYPSISRVKQNVKKA